MPIGYTLVVWLRLDLLFIPLYTPLLHYHKNLYDLKEIITMGATLETCIDRLVLFGTRINAIQMGITIANDYLPSTLTTDIGQILSQLESEYNTINASLNEKLVETNTELFAKNNKKYNSNYVEIAKNYQLLLVSLQDKFKQIGKKVNEYVAALSKVDAQYHSLKKTKIKFEFDNISHAMSQLICLTKRLPTQTNIPEQFVEFSLNAGSILSVDNNNDSPVPTKKKKLKLSKLTTSTENIVKKLNDVNLNTNPESSELVKKILGYSARFHAVDCCMLLISSFLPLQLISQANSYSGKIKACVASIINDFILLESTREKNNEKVWLKNKLKKSIHNKEQFLLQEIPKLIKAIVKDFNHYNNNFNQKAKTVSAAKDNNEYKVGLTFVKMAKQTRYMLNLNDIENPEINDFTAQFLTELVESFPQKYMSKTMLYEESQIESSSIYDNSDRTLYDENQAILEMLNAIESQIPQNNNNNNEENDENKHRIPFNSRFG